MHCNFASLLVAAFLALPSIAQSDEVTFDSASADIQNQLEVAIAELQFSNRHFQLVLDVGGRRIESDLIGLSDGGKRQEGSNEERSKVAMHQSDPS